MLVVSNTSNKTIKCCSGHKCHRKCPQSSLLFWKSDWAVWGWRLWVALTEGEKFAAVSGRVWMTEERTCSACVRGTFQDSVCRFGRSVSCSAAPVSAWMFVRHNSSQCCCCCCRPACERTCSAWKSPDNLSENTLLVLVRAQQSPGGAFKDALQWIKKKKA